MDPFLGLGSSAVAAARLDVDFVGVEMDEHYLTEAIRRVKQELNASGLVRIGDVGVAGESGGHRDSAEPAGALSSSPSPLSAWP